MELNHTMIEEAYCSFEVAKLLNEKRFEAYTYMVYKLPSQLFHMDEERLVRNDNGITKGDCTEILAPTHQMAMAWLREVHDIIIVIEPHAYDYINEKNSSYVTSLWQGDNYYENVTLKNYPTYEEAVEETLKFSLKNLLQL